MSAPVEVAARGAAVPRVVVAPDKFKGSLSAAAVAAHVSAGLKDVLPHAEITAVPIADGGDGTVASALAAGFSPVTVEVTGPLGDPVRATFAIGDGRPLGASGTVAAVIELATASGLDVLPRTPSGQRRPDALRATSRGTGELVRAALDAGAGLVVLGVGGSACTDGGAGLLVALGARITDDAGHPVDDGGAALTGLVEVDLSGLDPRVATTRFLLATDVDHPLLGARGAAEVFAPQKGADPTQVALLEAGLSTWAERLTSVLPGAAAAAGSPGAGAAGGVGFAALAVLGAEAVPGIDLVIDLVDLERLTTGADLVVTGEGSLDEQSLAGKAPVGVARLAGRLGVRTVAVCGRTSLTTAQLEGAGIDAAYPLTDEEPDVARCIAEPAPLLRRVGRRIGLTFADRSPSA